MWPCRILLCRGRGQAGLDGSAWLWTIYCGPRPSARRELALADEPVRCFRLHTSKKKVCHSSIDSGLLVGITFDFFFEFQDDPSHYDSIGRRNLSFSVLDHSLFNATACQEWIPSTPHLLCQSTLLDNMSTDAPTSEALPSSWVEGLPLKTYTASCHCKLFVFTFKHPDLMDDRSTVLDCNCSFCKQKGILWLYVLVSFDYVQYNDIFIDVGMH